jgi:quercetin dioxygenase-like cupin family protein
MKKQIVFELQDGDLLPLRNARGARITCLEGTLWITLEHQRNDIVLNPGQSYSVPKNGTTLVQGMGASRIGVEALGAAPQLAFPASPDLARAAV